MCIKWQGKRILRYHMLQLPNFTACPNLKLEALM
jgi:hypothetical protein